MQWLAPAGGRDSGDRFQLGAAAEYVGPRAQVEGMLAQRTTHASRSGSLGGRRASEEGVYSSEVGRLWRHLRGCGGLRGAERGLSERVCGLQVGEASCQVECTRIFELLHTKLQPKVRWHDHECRRWIRRMGWCLRSTLKSALWDHKVDMLETFMWIEQGQHDQTAHVDLVLKLHLIWP